MGGGLRALFLLGTLKQSAESEIVRLIDYGIRPGVYTNIGGDDWPKILEKIMASIRR